LTGGTVGSTGPETSREDDVERGPLEVLVVSFPGEEVPEGVDVALSAMKEVGDIRVISGMTVTRPLEGPPEVTQIASFQDVGDIVADIVGHTAVGVPNADAIDEVVATLEPGSTALLLVVEHVWAVGVAEEIRAAGGRLVDAVRLPSDVLAAAEEVLGGQPAPSPEP
jgi:uncharacterized membrane protein